MKWYKAGGITLAFSILNNLLFPGQISIGENTIIVFLLYWKCLSMKEEKK